MGINECARLVEAGDHDRFLAAMAAPPDARAVLFPLYAFNLEVARAPYVTSEPMLAEIRLQWWRDALEEIRAGRTPRRHEVVTPLADVIDAQACGALGRIADTRLWDISGEPFASEAQFRAHLDRSAGNLAWTAARLLGSRTETAVRGAAFAEGLMRWFRAVPDLSARGLRPLIDDTANAIRDMSRDALAGLSDRPDRAGRIATLSAWEARPVLRLAIRDPQRVLGGALHLSPFAKRARLMAAALRL